MNLTDRAMRMLHGVRPYINASTPMGADILKEINALLMEYRDKRSPRPDATPEQIHRARKLYADDEIEIDGDAVVSKAEDGVWVSAWVWVGDEEA